MSGVGDDVRPVVTGECRKFGQTEDPGAAVPERHPGTTPSTSLPTLSTSDQL
jgi:hypothetical protein